LGDVPQRSDQAAAQQRPDFSGRWILISAPTATVPLDMTVSFWVSDSSGPRQYVDVTRRLGTGQYWRFVLMIDSPLVHVPTGSDRMFAAFEGETFVIHNLNRLIPSSDKTFQRDVWSLTSEGNLRVLTTERSASADQATTEWIFRRVE
jgi:hypothetical protein